MRVSGHRKFGFMVSAMKTKQDLTEFESISIYSIALPLNVQLLNLNLPSDFIFAKFAFKVSSLIGNLIMLYFTFFTCPL